MPETEDVDVVAMRSVRSIHVIDGGDTVALRMEIAGGGETCVLLPTGAVGDLLFLLADALAPGHGGDPPKARRRFRTSRKVEDGRSGRHPEAAGGSVLVDGALRGP